MRRVGLSLLTSALALGALTASAAAADWSVTQIAAPEQVNLFAVSCPTASLCVATGTSGTVATSADPTGGAGAWQVLQPGGPVFAGRRAGGREELYFNGAQIRGVSCPTTGLCVAASFDGNLYASTDPTGGVGAWQVFPTGPEHSPHIHMTGVSCPTAGLCVAVGYAGKVLVSTEPAGGTAAWRVDQLPEPLDLRGVSCYSAGLCVAVDNEGDVLASTDPEGGATTWQVTRAPAGSETLSGVSCPSTQLCVSGNAGRILSSTSPATGAWHAVTAGSGLPVMAVSCPTASACAAVDNNADVISSTDPTGPAGAWSFQNVIPANGPNGTFGISCPTLRFCAVAGTADNILTSTDPFAAEEGGSGGSQQAGTSRPRRPRVRIAFHPGRRVADHGKRRVRVTFRFRATAPRARFRCRLNRHHWTRCHSPKRYRLRRGKYVFSVLAIGPTGLKGAPTAFHFRIGPLREPSPVGSCGPEQPGNTHPCVPTG